MSRTVGGQGGSSRKARSSSTVTAAQRAAPGFWAVLLELYPRAGGLHFGTAKGGTALGYDGTNKDRLIP